MYGKYKRSFGKSSSRYTSAAPRRNRRYAMGKVARYNRKSTIAKRLNKAEIKYNDAALNFNSWQETVHGGLTTTGVGAVNYVLGGIVSSILDPGGQPTGVSVSAVGGGGSVGASGNLPILTAFPNCLTNVDSGTTAKTRIGNIIQPRYLRMQCVFGGAKTNHPQDAETTWKDEPNTVPSFPIERYARTSMRVYIVRDKNMNEKGYVNYEDLFEDPGTIGNTRNNSRVGPFLWNRKVDTMGRYEILKEKEFTLDADDPQKSFTFVVALKGVPIKYNGSVTNTLANSNNGTTYWNTVGAVSSAGLTPAVTGLAANINQVVGQQPQSMTNGVYVLAVAHCYASAGNASNWVSPEMMFSTRMTFQD